MDKNDNRQFFNASGKGKPFRQMLKNDECQRLAACKASGKGKHFREMDKNDKISTQTQSIKKRQRFQTNR